MLTQEQLREISTYDFMQAKGKPVWFTWGSEDVEYIIEDQDLPLELTQQQALDFLAEVADDLKDYVAMQTLD